MERGRQVLAAGPRASAASLRQRQPRPRQALLAAQAARRELAAGPAEVVARQPVAPAQVAGQGAQARAVPELVAAVQPLVVREGPVVQAEAVQQLRVPEGPVGPAEAVQQLRVLVELAAQAVEPLRPVRVQLVPVQGALVQVAVAPPPVPRAQVVAREALAGLAVAQLRVAQLRLGPGQAERAAAELQLPALAAAAPQQEQAAALQREQALAGLLEQVAAQGHQLNPADRQAERHRSHQHR